MTAPKKRRQWTICYTVEFHGTGGGASGTTWVYAYTSRGLSVTSIKRQAAADVGVSVSQCRIVNTDYIR